MSAVLLPSIADEDDLTRTRLDLGRWREAVVDLARHHGIGGEPEPEPTGTLPVFTFPDAVLKLYAPASFWSGAGSAEAFPDHDTEVAVLRALEGRLPVATPRILGEGERDGWRYSLMSRIGGAPLESLWRLAPPELELDAMRALGEAIAALHRIEASDLPWAIVDFDAFLLDQEQRVVEIERARGCPDVWLEPVARFVAETPRGERGEVLLHTELGPSHVLATAGPEGFVLEGIIDWVEAMRGDPEYDLAAVALFIARGDGRRLGAFLDGYGWDGPRGRPLAERLMRYVLLHRYAPLAWLLKRAPVPAARECTHLAEAWMGLAT